MVKQMKQGSEQEVREAFKAYDTDNKGYFTKDELLKLLNIVSQQSKDIKISKAEIEELVNFLARNGRVDFDSKWNIAVQLLYCSAVYYPWGKMGITRSLIVFPRKWNNHTPGLTSLSVLFPFGKLFLVVGLPP